jgi:hypothetical protein
MLKCLLRKEYVRYTAINTRTEQHLVLHKNINPLCTKLIIWEESSTCHYNKTPTEKGQLMGNPVYTWVEGWGLKQLWFMKEQIQKYARKYIKGGCYLKVTLVHRGLRVVSWPLYPAFFLIWWKITNKCSKQFFYCSRWIVPCFGIQMPSSGGYTFVCRNISG